MLNSSDIKSTFSLVHSSEACYMKRHRKEKVLTEFPIFERWHGIHSGHLPRKVAGWLAGWVEFKDKYGFGCWRETSEYFQ